ncbi:hypothetical protein [Haloferula sp. BvORR071]|uniref:hypothetical protein n=1 Tax=Haloferula sp. BvORR071 TaxID=1396141 RepID=UPI00054F3EFD|nr:hypothetical protein [Haloferula sp. BvORR071]
MNNYLLAALVLGLTALSFIADRFRNPDKVFRAWFWLALIAFVEVAAGLFRAGNYTRPNDMLLAEIWSNAFQWLFMGLALLSLASLRKPGLQSRES